jgi:prephenate dehydratase
MNLKKVSIQGEPGAFHHIACEQYFKEKVKIIFRQTFDEVFDDLINKKCDYSIAAAKSSEFGEIPEVHKLMELYKVSSIDEVKVHINFCLLGTGGSELSEIEQVYSQLPALEACKDFLKANLPQTKINKFYDTAGAAKFVSKQDDSNLAAIASKKAAEIYGLKILTENIGNSPDTHTHFYVFAAS